MSSSLHDKLQAALGESYVLERELAPGGMSRLFLAIARGDGRRTVVKTLPPELASEVNVARFQHEIEVTARLQHPRILSVTGAGSASGVLYYLMPYVDGQSLRARLDREKQLPLEDAVRIAVEVAEALAHAHGAGVIHRDIKPDNILLSADGAIVADFGISRALVRASGESITSTGIALGSPAYMSPEQASGAHDLDGRSDLYCLGCVLFEMLAGIPPFPGATPDAVIGRRFKAPAPSVRELRETVSPHIERVIARVLLRSPADRYQTAEHFMRALTSPTVDALEWASIRRRRIWRAGVASVAILLTVALALPLFVSQPLRAAVRHTRSVRALRAYAAGRSALEEWRIADASADLRAAREADPSFPEATVWFSQAAAWNDVDPAQAWLPALLGITKTTARLSRRDSTLAASLVATAQGRFPDACRMYDAMLKTDSTDVIAWVGRGDCNAHDPIVVGGRGGGWRTRGSYQAAVQSYLRAVQLTPARDRAFPMARLKGTLSTAAVQLKNGFATTGTGDTAWFELSPMLRGDTLALAPIPQDRSAALAPELAALPAALTYGRRLLRDVSTEWVAGAPESPLAREALAQALEETGELTSGRDGSPSAIESARAALRLASDSMQRLRLYHLEIRLLLKTGQFPAARQLAESVLVAWRDPDPQAASYLATLAVIVGKTQAASALTQRAAVRWLATASARGQRLRLHPSLVAESQALYAYASVGAPAESIRAIARRVESLLGSYLVEPMRSNARFGLLTRPLSLAVPTLGPAVVSRERPGGDYLVTMQQALGRGDRRAVRREYEEVLSWRRSELPTDESIDAVFQESWLLAAIGDTAAAVHHLDASLNALPALDAHLIDQLFGAGALVQAMVLRADLAERLADREGAKHWGQAVVALWVDADPSLQDVVSRMRTYY